jgi:SEC-C motif
MTNLVARSEGEVFDNLERLCTTDGFVHALGYLAITNNTFRYATQVTAKAFEHQHEPGHLIRSELDLLFGLLTKRQLNFTCPDPAKMQLLLDEAKNLLSELHQSMIEPGVHALGAHLANPNPEHDVLSSGVFLREAMFYGGESAQDFQYLDLSCLKFGNDKDWLERHKGFGPAVALEIATAIVDIQNSRLSSIHSDFQKIHPDDWDFLNPLSFTSEEVVARTNVDTNRVDRFLEEYSIESTASTNSAYTAPSEFNEVTARPILRRSSGRFVLFSHYGLAEALYTTPYFWMVKDKNYGATLSDNRGKYVEDFSAACLRRVFGRDSVHERVLLVKANGDRIGEIDVLVIYANRAIVVQAKSKGLTQNSKRGFDDAIKDDFQKSVQDAYNQAFRCAELLNCDDIKLVSATLSKHDELPRFNEIYLFCVVSENYPALAHQSRQFLVPSPHPIIKFPFVIDVFFLDVMCEILRSPLYFLSYTNRRVHYADRLLAGHELTILAFHLKANLWLDEDTSMLHLSDDIGVDLDIAMMARRRGIPGASVPAGILTRLANTTIARIIQDITSRSEPPLLDLGLELLKLSEPTLKLLSSSIDQAIVRSRKDRNLHDVTIATSHAGLSVHVTDRPDEEAKSKLLVHCELRKYRMRAGDWYGLCISATSGLPRFATKLDSAWVYNAELALHSKRLSVEAPLGGGIVRANRIKVGRNDRCPCRSGKKYKRCCLGS